MESTIRTLGQNGRKSVADEMEISDWNKPLLKLNLLGVRQLYANFWHSKTNASASSFSVVAHISRVLSQQEVKIDVSVAAKMSMFDWK